MVELRIRETCYALFKSDYVCKNIGTYLLKSTLIENILKKTLPKILQQCDEETIIDWEQTL